MTDINLALFREFLKYKADLLIPKKPKKKPRTITITVVLGDDSSDSEAQ